MKGKHKKLDTIFFQKETPVDAKVMQYMITRAALLLRSYPTTLEQDQATMKDSKVN